MGDQHPQLTLQFVLGTVDIDHLRTLPIQAIEGSASSVLQYIDRDPGARASFLLPDTHRGERPMVVGLAWSMIREVVLRRHVIDLEERIAKLEERLISALAVAVEIDIERPA